jgi:hypothetical protein
MMRGKLPEVSSCSRTSVIARTLPTAWLVQRDVLSEYFKDSKHGAKSSLISISVGIVRGNQDRSDQETAVYEADHLFNIAECESAGNWFVHDAGGNTGVQTVKVDVEIDLVDASRQIVHAGGDVALGLALVPRHDRDSGVVKAKLFGGVDVAHAKQQCRVLGYWGTVADTGP